MGGRIHERPVKMPGRWVRALGNAAEIHREMKPVFALTGARAQAFIASLPPATGKHQSGWLTPAPAGAKLMPRPSKDAAYISGLHRLSALKRVMTNISEITCYMPEDGAPGPFMIAADLPGARLTLSLTAEAWQGYSGEGSLLESLAKTSVLENAENILSALAFDAAIDEMKIARDWGISDGSMQEALAVLAVSGKLGFDAHGLVWFHRELPDDPDRVMKDNPRLAAAGGLAAGVEKIAKDRYTVRSGESDYMVYWDIAKDIKEAKCTCTWYLNHQNRRGPCKHMLAVQLSEQ
jgi:hypothetical protein